MKGIPLATAPDWGQVEAVRPLLDGRACVVIGSAPLVTRHAHVGEDECVIAVNGGISSTLRVVDLWVVGSKLWDAPMQRNARPLHRQMLEQATGRTVRHTLLLRGPKAATEPHTLAVLADLRCQVQHWSVLDKPTKRQVERQLCDRVHDDAPCSSGILAAAVALWCGAFVRLEGFSLKAGYHYLKQTPPAWWRDHVEADRRALVALRAHYGNKLSGALVEAVAA
jgi:hypothetical protein